MANKTKIIKEEFKYIHELKDMYNYWTMDFSGGMDEMGNTLQEQLEFLANLKRDYSNRVERISYLGRKLPLAKQELNHLEMQN